MTKFDARSLIAELPQHVAEHVLTLLTTPLANRGIYEAQRILTYHLGSDLANEIIRAMVRENLAAIERIN